MDLGAYLRNFFLGSDTGAFVGAYFMSFLISMMIVGLLAAIFTIVFAFAKRRSSEPIKVSLAKYTLGLLGISLSLSTLLYTQFVPFYPAVYWLFYILIAVDIVAFLLILAMRIKNKWLSRVLAAIPILIIGYIAFGMITQKDAPKTLNESPFGVEYVRQY